MVPVRSEWCSSLRLSPCSLAGVVVVAYPLGAATFPDPLGAGWDSGRCRLAHESRAFGRRVWFHLAPSGVCERRTGDRRELSPLPGVVGGTRPAFLGVRGLRPGTRVRKRDGPLHGPRTSEIGHFGRNGVAHPLAGSARRTRGPHSIRCKTARGAPWVRVG